MRKALNKTIVVLLSAGAAIIVGCSSTPSLLQPMGRSVTVETFSGQTMKGELIAIDRSHVQLGDTSFRRISLDSLKSLSVDIPQSRPWIIPVAIFEGLPTAALIGSVEPSPTLSISALILTAATVVALESSVPSRNFSPPWNDETFAQLNSWSRHAGNQTPDSGELASVPPPIPKSEVEATKVAHVVVTFVDGRQEFGDLLAKSPSISLHTVGGRILRAEPKFVLNIRHINPEDFSDTEWVTAWLVKRNDQSTVVASALTNYENGLLQVECQGSRIALSLDEIQEIWRIDNRGTWERGKTTGLVVGGGIALLGATSARHVTVALGGIVVGAILGAIAIPIAGTFTNSISHYYLPPMPREKRESTLRSLIELDEK